MSVLLLLADGAILVAQDVVLHTFHSSARQPAVEEVLYYAAGVALIRHGLSSSRTAQHPAYQLDADYSVGTDSVTVNYTFSEKARPLGKPVTLSVRISMGDALDSQVAAAMDQIVTAAGLKTQFSRAATIEGLLSSATTTAGAPAESAAGGASGKSGRTTGQTNSTTGAQAAGTTQPPGRGSSPTGSASASSSGAGGQSSAEGSTPGEGSTMAEGPASTEGPPSAQTPEPAGGAGPPEQKVASPTGGASVRPQLWTSVGGAGFFGKAADFFHYGLTATVGGDVQWVYPRFRVGPSLQFSAIREFNDPNVFGGPIYFILGGAGVDVGSGSATPWRIGGGASGGAALITVANATDRVSKFAPFAEASVTASAPLAGLTRLGFAFQFVAIFDPAQPFFALTTGLSFLLAP